MAEAPSAPHRQDSTVEKLLNCPICHQQLSGVSITHCSHRFCTPCIYQWLERNPNCPTCRTKLTRENLIEDRDFDELVRLFNERPTPCAQNVDGQQQQQQQPSGRDGISVDDMSNILQSVMPQRDQDVRNLTDNLLVMKDREITRLGAINQEHTTTIGQLNGNIDRLQAQLDNELPGLRERIRELQEKIERKRQQKQLLKGKVRELENNVTIARTERTRDADQKNDLKENIEQMKDELQETKESWDESKEEIVELKMEVQSCKDEIQAKQTQLEKSEITQAQMKDLTQRLLQQKQVSDGELGNSRQQCLHYQQHVLKLQMFESMFKERDQELKDLREKTLPQKDFTIIQLQNQTSDLISQLANLSQNTIPMHQHVKTCQTQLEQTNKQLQSYYDTLYGNRITMIEDMNDRLQKQKTELEDKLKCREDVGDDLQKATKTYKKLLNENSDFHETMKEKDQQIKRLQQDLTQSKKRTNTLEQKMSLMKNLRED